MSVACFDILVRRNGCGRGDDEAGRSGGLVLEVHWLTGEWSCMYNNSKQRAGQCRDSLCRYQATCLEVGNWNSMLDVVRAQAYSFRFKRCVPMPRFRAKCRAAKSSARNKTDSF
jgi:hypothetical protein